MDRPARGRDTPDGSVDSLMMRHWPGVVMAVVMVGVMAVVLADAAHGLDGPLKSGSSFLTEETRALQQDDFQNPGMLWVNKGEALFHDERDGQPCAACHTDGRHALKGAAAGYPAIDAQSGKLLNMEGRINLCRMRYQQKPPLTYESDDLLALTAYVTSLSQALPMTPPNDVRLAPYVEQGRRYFMTRRGQLNLACHQCHDQNWGKKLRGDTISQGHPNGFPAYRFAWQGFGSLHRRLNDCDLGVRAKPFAPGSPQYLAVEAYLAERARGLKLESPAIRR